MWLWPLVLLAAGIGLAYGAAIVEHRANRESEREAVRVQLEPIRGALSRELFGAIQLTEGLSALVAVEGGLTEERFNSFAAELVRRNGLIRNVAIAPDNVVRFVYPLAGSEAAVGLDYRANADQWPSVARMMQDQRLTVAGPVRLVQGGVGVIGRSPIYVADAAGTPRYWGLTATVVDFESLLARTPLDAAGERLSIALRGVDGTGQRGAPFWGAPDVFDDAPVVVDVPLPSGTWQLAATPRTGWRPFRALDSSYFLAGSLFALILAGFLATVLRTAAARDLEVVQRLESEGKLRAIFEQAPLGIAVLDARDGSAVELNPRFRAIVGDTDDEMRALSAAALPPAPERAWAHDRTAGVEQVLQHEMRLVRTDGSHVWVSLTAVALADASAEGAPHLALVEDITERRRAEADLREREERLSSIYETVGDVIFQLAVEPGGRYRFVSVNPAVTTVLGYAAESVLGKRVVEVFPEDVSETVVHKFGEAVAERRVVRWEQAGSFPAGRLIGEVSVAPVLDVKGRCVYLVGSFRDISERRKAEAQLIATDRLAALGMLAAGVAHEINNPLAAVMANLDVSLQGLSAGPATSPALLEQLGDARDCADRIRVIVRDLKIFSRAEEEERSAVHVSCVLDSTLRMVWNELRHRARLVRRDGDGIPPVEANESRLGQVFLNLVVNAYQAIPPGDAEGNEIAVSTRLTEGGEVVVEIADTGTGMSPEVVQKLFTPFFTTKAVGVGTGLGLAICQRIIADLGGRIEVTSEPGAGTTFSVHLPRADEVEVAEARPVVQAPPARRRGRVLVVDDEPLLGTAIRRILSSEHEVVTTTMASAAIELLEAGERFDVILCDLMMPDITGMKFHAELARVAPEQIDAMIFMTGGAFTAEAREFLDRVSNARFEKPFNQQQLRALVNERVS